MKYRRHDCKNTGMAVPYLKKGEKRELDQCLRRDHCPHKNHYGGIVFCNESPLFDTPKKEKKPEPEVTHD